MTMITNSPILATVSVGLTLFLAGCSASLHEEFLHTQVQGNWWVIETDFVAWQPGRLHQKNLKGRVNRLFVQKAGGPPVECVVSISPSSVLWVCETSEEEYYLLNILEQTCEKIDLPYRSARTFYWFSWSPDNQLLAIASYDDTGVSITSGVRNLWIYRIDDKTLVQIKQFVNVPNVPSQTFLSPMSWLDNHRVLIGGSKNQIMELDLENNKVKPFVTAYQVLVLPGGRALLQTDCDGDEWNVVNLSSPQHILSTLGDGSLIGTPSDKGLSEGVRPPMHRFVTVSPDGRWVLVEVCHVVGTWLGFAAPANKVYLRRIEDDRCWLLGGQKMAKHTDPGWAHWVAISRDVALTLGLPEVDQRK